MNQIVQDQNYEIRKETKINARQELTEKISLFLVLCQWSWCCFRWVGKG